MLVYEQRSWGEDRTQILVPRPDLGTHKTTKDFKRAISSKIPEDMRSGIYICIPETCITNAVKVTVTTQTVIGFEENKDATP